MDLNFVNLELKKKLMYIDYFVLGYINKGIWESLVLCLEFCKFYIDENIGIYNLMNILILIKIEVSVGFKIVIR